MIDAFIALHHNEALMKKAENIISAFLESENENHKVGCYIENPDEIQKGFKLISYELVTSPTKRKNNYAKRMD